MFVFEHKFLYHLCRNLSAVTRSYDKSFKFSEKMPNSCVKSHKPTYVPGLNNYHFPLPPEMNEVYYFDFLLCYGLELCNGFAFCI